MNVSDLKVKVNISDLVGSVESLREIKAKKNGELTPKEITRVLLNDLLQDDIEELVIVTRHKNGQVTTGWSSNDAIQTLGMIELLKIDVSKSVGQEE